MRGVLISRILLIDLLGFGRVMMTDRASDRRAGDCVMSGHVA
jgi:hypothetical protein